MPEKLKIKKSALTPTILIAGGAGFIGSHLAEALLMRDARVIVLDNFATGKDTFVSGLLQNPKFALFDCDINQGLPEDIESVDYVIHLAGLETYLYGTENIDLDYLLTNAVGTKHLLELTKKSEAKMLLVSSIDVYKGIISPMNLDHYFGQTLQEERKYSNAEAKRFAEALVWEFYKKYQTNVRIVRLPEVYGPRMNLDASGNLGRLINDLLSSKNLTIYGEGTEEEFYLYINDAVSGIIKALFNKNTEGKIYTLVEKEPYAVLETTYLLKSLANKPTEVEFKPQTVKVKNPIIKLDVTTAAELNWEPKTDFKEGLRKTLKWFKYELNEYSFKPNKLVEEKLNKKEDEFTSLADIKGTTPRDEKGFFETKNVSYINDLAKEKETNRIQSFTLPKWDNKMPSFPRISLPKIKLLQTKEKIATTNPLVTSKVSRSQTKMNNFSEKLPGNEKSIFFGLLVGFLSIFIVFPSIDVYISATRAKTAIEKVPNLISQLKSREAQKQAEIASKNFNRASRAFKNLEWVAKLAGQGNSHFVAQKMLNSAFYNSKAAENIAQASTPLLEIWEIVRPTSTKAFNSQKIKETTLYFSNAKTQLQLAKAEIESTKELTIPGFISNEYKTIQNSINNLEPLLEIATTVANETPNLLGEQTPKRYLILLQNSNELRPTGGFIGSYAILEMNKGKIANLTIDDIYNPDGQIQLRNIKVPSPTPIRKLLEEENLFIRNANWNPDFPESARTISDLFYRLDGKEFDGVFAVDLFFAKKLLEATGPLYLTAYSEEISAENMYERTQYHSGFDYQEGVSDKKSFLTVFGSKLLEELFATPNEEMPNLISKIFEALMERHLQMYLPNNQLRAYIHANNWDGAIRKTDKDFLYVVNANLGGTKSNYFVKDNMNYEVSSDTRDGILRGKLSLNYEHTGESNAWPGGPYKNYVRVFVQKGSKLTGAKIINNKQEQDIFEEIVISQTQNNEVFETSFVLETGEKAVVIFEYDLPRSLAFSKESKEYSLLWQKQAGTNDIKVTFNFKPTFGTKLVKAAPTPKSTEGAIMFEDSLDTDKIFSVILD